MVWALFRAAGPVILPASVEPTAPPDAPRDPAGPPRRDAEPPLAAGGEPVLDCAVALDYVDGSEELLNEMVGLYFEENAQLMAQLETAIPAGDAPTVERAAHTIKSSSAMLGARATQGVAERIEQMGKRAELAGATDALARLKAEIVRLRTALRDAGRMS